MIRLKSEEEIDHIRRAGVIASKTLDVLRETLRAGITTYRLDEIAEDFIISEGATPAFKNYKGFPGNICTSIDNVIVHGIPDRKTFLRDDSIISIDVGIKLNGYYADSAYTFAVGTIEESRKKLIQITKEALYRGIDRIKAGGRLGDVSYCIQNFAETNGFSVVRDFVGHGVGYDIHEDPEIPNFGQPNEGIRLEEGMVLAIEPMINEGEYCTKVSDDGWTVFTKDGSSSCHFEHTVAITKEGAEILTKWQKKMQ